ncbi:MAG TPA: hypothetical protein VD996_16695, partial [Chitinophagaceae bacterium]|nr:hypothetical protein [Chitinophagaceae bacterium]
MKRIIFFTAFLLCMLRSQSQNIVAAEYFFDHDPGVGSAAPLSVGSPGTTVNFTASIPTTTLSEGFHTLAIRTKDENGVWSLFESRGVYVSRTVNDLSAITAAEYFIDHDPGPGNATPVNVGATGNTVQFTLVIPTTSLLPGFHTLAIRTRTVNGTWGLFETRAFYISTATADMGVLT